VVTTTSAAPAVPGGAEKVIEPALSAVTEPASPPTVTVADSRFAPLMTTLVPPAVVPRRD